MANPRFPVGGRGLPRQLRFETVVCRNKRIWTLGGCTGYAPLRSANAFCGLIQNRVQRDIVEITEQKSHRNKAEILLDYLNRKKSSKCSTFIAFIVGSCMVKITRTFFCQRPTSRLSIASQTLIILPWKDLDLKNLELVCDPDLSKTKLK